MDVSVVYEEREIVKIPYTSIPSFFLLLRENGFPFKWDEQNGKIQLLPGLAGKTIFILKETFKAPYSAQRVIKKFIDDISFFLKGSGASIYSEKNLPLNVSADLRIILDMYEDPSIDQPSLTVHHDMKPHNHKWIYILKEECREAGIDFTTNVKEAETQPYMKFLMKVPRSAQPVFTESLNKKFQLIISMGILARFQTNNPLFFIILSSSSPNFFSSVNS
ncbi:hypothetical protein QFZ28_004001 [Neobacillus niacini]|uniref:hypothetical protein n=1 Tax=Neobacillus niacini TaxID=86668 RepID=UPI00277D40B0|nr:hypothetical protein [Neobacillus niacini]MDQ1003601.1 hypothetical protein [Neobacillus niacini]